MDASNYKATNNPKSRSLLLQSLETYNLTDTYRYFHRETRRYTWWRKNPLQQARLDHTFVTNGPLDYIDNYHIKPGYRTDHSIVKVTMTFCKFKRGKGVCKFNCSLLKDSEYIQQGNKTINVTRQQYAIPVYNPCNIENISDSDIHFVIDDSEFLEVLLLKSRWGIY